MREWRQAEPGDRQAAPGGDLLRTRAMVATAAAPVGNKRTLVAMQRTAGNRAVAGLMGSLRAVQRQCQDQSGRPVGRALPTVTDLLVEVATNAARRGASRLEVTIRHADGQLVPGWRVEGQGPAITPDPRLRGSVRALLDAIALSSPGVYALHFARLSGGDFSLLGCDRTATIPLPVRHAPEPPAQRFTVVVIGSPNLGQRYVHEFVTAAERETGSPIVWLVERTGYEIRGVALRKIEDRAPGELLWITPESPLTTVLNRFPPHSIRRLIVYSHGYAGRITLRNGWADRGAPDYGLTTDEARGILGDPFTNDAEINLESCQAGVRASGISLAEALAGSTGRPVTAWTGRTSYADVNARTGGVRGSTYTTDLWDSAREFWVRNWAAGEAPQRQTFRPPVQRATGTGSSLRSVQRHQAETVHTHPPQWENPDLVASIYTRRADMMRFVISQMARERYQGIAAMRGGAQTEALSQLRQEMQQRLTEIQAAPPPVPMVPTNARPGTVEQAQQQALARRVELVSSLQSMLADDQMSLANARRFLNSEADVDARREGMLTAGVAVETLTDRALAAMHNEQLPSWAIDIVRQYGGMRYQSAHGSWLPGRYLVALVELHDTEHPDAPIVRPGPDTPASVAAPTPARRGRRRLGSAAVRPSLDEAGGLTRLEEWHEAGVIPEPAWRAVVQFTELRTQYPSTEWESIGRTLPADLTPPWRELLTRWRADNLTAWRRAMQGRPDRVIVTRIVCNELAEHIMARLGIRLPGGISANADWLYQRSVPAPGRAVGPIQQVASPPSSTDGAASAAVDEIGSDLVPPQGTAAPGPDRQQGGSEPGADQRTSTLPGTASGPEVVAADGGVAPVALGTDPSQATSQPPPITTIDGTGHLVPVGTGGQEVGAPASPPGPFFKHGPSVTAADMVPGAQLFFVDREWSLVPQPHDTVRPVPGVVYHVPPARAGGNPGPPLSDGLVHEDWTYHVTQEHISRSRTTQLAQTGPPERELGTGSGARRSAPPPAPGRPRIEYMRWSHQATVVRVAQAGNRVLTLETTGRGAGLGARALTDLQRPDVFVAWVQPGTTGGGRE